MISINKAPAKYTPVDSPVLFQLTSNNPNTVYFGVQVLDPVTSDIIANQKYQLLPNYSGGTAFDLSSILSSYVDYQVVASDNLIEATPQLSQAYNLNITEMVVSGATIVSGTTLTGGTYNVWNAELDRVKFTGYQYQNYALTASGSTTRFLTNKPLISNLYMSSTEYLYFLNDGLTAGVKYDLHGSGNTLLGTHIVTGVTPANTAYRLNLSPAVIQDLYGNFDYLTVQLVTGTGVTKSEIRTFVLKDDNCKAEPVQLLFSNSLGGFDSVTFFNPLETVTATKSSISTYPYQINPAGDYTNINDGVYNETDKVYNVDSVSTYKVYSEILTDATAVWIKELIGAKVVYVKLADDTLLPITIITTNYSVLKSRYNTNNNRLGIEFKIKESGLKF